MPVMHQSSSEVSRLTQRHSSTLKPNQNVTIQCYKAVKGPIKVSKSF